MTVKESERSEKRMNFWRDQLPTFSGMKWRTRLLLSVVLVILVRANMERQLNCVETGMGYGLPVNFVIDHFDGSVTWSPKFAIVALVSALLLLRIVYVISELRVWDAMCRGFIAIDFRRHLPVDRETTLPERFPLHFHLSSYFVAMLVAAALLYLNCVPPKPDYYYSDWLVDYQWYGFPFRIFRQYADTKGNHSFEIHSQTSLIAQVLVGLTATLGAVVGCEVVGGLRREGTRFVTRLWSFLRPSLWTFFLGRCLLFVGLCIFVINTESGKDYYHFGWPLRAYVSYGDRCYVSGYRDLAFDMYLWLAIILIPCIVCETVVRRRRRARLAEQSELSRST